jgi:hypothetical protein
MNMQESFLGPALDQIYGKSAENQGRGRKKRNADLIGLERSISMVERDAALTDLH